MKKDAGGQSMNEVKNNEYVDFMDIYQKSENIISDMQVIIDTSQRQAHQGKYVSGKAKLADRLSNC
jgi:DNA polymerase III gamma/tau subunit